ncbi:MAG: DUF1294 domain-containing protein [Planctomycetes bacterium]|nr:DUF1294 domain-containing protein [Planctomycetota bacterium]
MGISLITFVQYGWDKRQARKQKRRIPEKRLHLLALAGGTPGAFLGQLTFRHKTRKKRFQIVFIGVVLLQMAVIATVIYLKNRN